MDIRSMINSDAAAATPAQAQAQAHVQAQAQAPPPRPSPSQQRHRLSDTYQASPFGSAGPTIMQNVAYTARPPPPPPTPLFHHPSHEHRSMSGSVPPGAHLTPLQTPQQTPGPPYSSGPYPFPAQAYQSPAQPHPPQQHPSRDSYSALTPGPRPSLFSQPHGQPSPSQYQANAPRPYLQHSNSHSSLSLTPGSVHGQTPAQESPVSSNSFSHTSQLQQFQQHPSTPSTPLGPPSHSYGRIPTHAPPISPYAIHQRGHSGTSYSAPLSIGSVSPPPPSAGGMSRMADSPASYGHPMPQPQRRSTEYVKYVERERSVSVSPKTQLPPRRLSSVSRQGSYGSQAANGQQAMNGYSQFHTPATGAPPSVTNDQNSSTMYYRTPLDPLFLGSAKSSLHRTSTDPSSERRSEDHHHRSQTPQLSNLLQPLQPLQHHALDESMDSSSAGTDPHAQSRALRELRDSQPPVAQTEQLQAQTRLPSSHLITPGPLLEPNSSLNADSMVTNSSSIIRGATEMPQQAQGNKRPVGVDYEVSQPKRTKNVKYDHPPPWAQLATTNPRHANLRKAGQQQVAKPHDSPSSQVLQRPQPQSQATQPNGSHAAPNGAGPPSIRDLHEAPKVTEKDKMANALGHWERNIKDQIQLDPFTKAVMDFLFLQVMRYRDLWEAQAGTGQLEIEAKIGTLINRDTENRLSLPVLVPVVIRPDFAGRLKFESHMDVATHKHFNGFLNDCTSASRNQMPGVPPRKHISYTHRYERDSFATLSDAGVALLPEIARQEHHPGHLLKLRTTTDTKSNRIVAKIVKIRLADLDIHSPQTEFDCRISVNFEANLLNVPLPSHMTPDDLTLIDSGKEKQPDRNKDRMSYEHLAYRIDLTQVTDPDKIKTHELEVEVDAQTLGEQAVKLQNGQSNAFEDVVSGLVSNVNLLLRKGGS
ncbi:mRNA-capping enzyme subunit beta [Elasticomyces elasticus]|nr:mRNA-capping enzyme subunit beta [Elasticomyces elasticus]